MLFYGAGSGRTWILTVYIYILYHGSFNKSVKLTFYKRTFSCEKKLRNEIYSVSCGLPVISLVFGKINSTRRVRLPVNGMEDGTGRKASRNSAKVEMRCQSGRKSPVVELTLGVVATLMTDKTVSSPARVEEIFLPFVGEMLQSYQIDRAVA